MSKVVILSEVCEQIAIVEVGRTDISVWFYNKDGDRVCVTCSKYDCSYFSVNENLSAIVQDIEEQTEKVMSETDRRYLEKELYTTLAAWSLQDEDIYC